jgi:hypothetical protein
MRKFSQRDNSDIISTFNESWKDFEALLKRIKPDQKDRIEKMDDALAGLEQDVVNYRIGHNIFQLEDLLNKIISARYNLEKMLHGNDLTKFRDKIIVQIEGLSYQIHTLIEAQKISEIPIETKDKFRYLILKGFYIIDKGIEAYEDTFKSTFDPSYKEVINKLKNLAEKELKMTLKDEGEISNEGFEIKSITPDMVLDLWEKIQEMPDGQEKQKEEQKLESWRKALTI